MSIDSVIPNAWDALKDVVPIKHLFNCLISSKSCAQELQTNVGKLKYQVDWVTIAMEEAKEKSLHDSYRNWLGRATKALNGAGELLGKFEELRKTCFYWSLPDQSRRHQFSKMALQIEDIKRLTREGNTYSNSDQISTRPLIQLEEDTILESRAMIQAIMDALANKRNSVVGVYGMGGVGKSTLLDEVERIIRNKKSFDWVVTATVSQNPDIKSIQTEIANALGITAMKNKETIRGRAEVLRQRLEGEKSYEKKVLIILDNLYEELDLKSVGIPCGPDNKVQGCKLLITSRDGDVLRVEMGCDEAFQLYGLEKAEAKSLFESIGGDRVHEDDFKALVDKALDKCAGVPLLIVAMARRFRDASLPQWKDTMKNIEEFKDKNFNKLIDHMLQWSYHKLEGEVKSLLRLCIVYDVSKPSLQNLVRYGFGLELFQGVSSMEEARDRLSSHIHTLLASSLLLTSEDIGSFEIHDLIRNFVASFASILVLKDNEDKSITEFPMGKLQSCEGICLSYVEMKDLPQELNCPNLQIFLLFSNNESLYIPNSFFNSMTKLMVLSLTGICLTHLPSSIQLLESLHTLCLDDCQLEDVTILGKLKRLQILSFMGSKIQRLPKEIGQLVELRLLDLNHCSQLKIIEPGVLEGLVKLEELYMEYSFDRWNAMEQTSPTTASLIELNNMESLSTLHLSVSNPSALPGDLNVEKLINYKIKIGFMEGPRSKCKGSTALELKLEAVSNVLQKGCIKSILDRTDDLFLHCLDALVQSICALSEKGFPQLKHLDVQHSPSVHYILERSSSPAFEKLETLLLHNLINLKKICHNQICTTSFNTLKVVRVLSCEKMEVLFPLSVMRELPQLEEIEVADCKLIYGIVKVDYWGKLEFPKLLVLKLRDLPNIKSFFTDGSTSPSRTSDDQVGTQVTFFNGQQVAFLRLETLEIIGLDNLQVIFSPSVVKSLAQLRELIVSKCNKMKAVITEEEGLGLEIASASPMESEIAFNQLKYIKLDGLRELRCFSSGGYNLMFPLLEDIIVGGCPNMNCFSRGPTKAPNMERVQAVPNESSKSIKFHNCWEGSLNIAIHNMFVEMGTYAGVESAASRNC